MDQKTIIEELHKFQKENYRRFFSPEYTDLLKVGRQVFHHIANTQIVGWFEIGPFQWPLDLMMYMECIFRMKPRIIIETGTASGGSALFFADVLRRIHGPNNFRVITIEYTASQISCDLKIVPEIVSIIGSSIDPKVITDVYRIAHEVPGPIMVTLDSDHSAEHVAKELVTYADIVSPGQYIIVQDTYMSLYWNGTSTPDSQFDYANDPLGAVDVFLSCDNRFEVDMLPQRWLITLCPFGFLRRKI